MRFFRASGLLITLILICAGISMLYETFTSREPSPTGNTLIGAVCCSLALVLIFFLIPPLEK